MREKHPIDERFKALYDAEADPPEEVRDTLARHVGWGPGPKPAGQWRSWLFIAAGAALAVTSANYLGDGTNKTPVPELTRTRATAQVSVPKAPVSQEKHSNGRGKGIHQDVSAAPLPAEGGGIAPTAAAPDVNTTTHQQEPSSAIAEVPQPRSVPRPVPSQAPRISTTRTPERAASAHGEQIASTAVTDQPVPFSPMNSSAASQTRTEDARRMSGIIPDQRTIPNGTPLAAPHQAPYVLPAAQWWLGAYVGVGRLTGEWRGPDQEAMNAAERWRGSSQWGLLLGRRWRSGWSVSVGAGLGLTRSTFTYDEQLWEPFVDVDTNWTETFYNNTLDVVYTWSIDSVTSVRPGTLRNTNGRNQYGALQVPLTIAWHGDLRRWHLGALGGLTLWLPTQREGNALHRSASDARLGVIDLEDARTTPRFGPRLNAHVGLSLGYALTETISVFAEPTMTAPIGTFGQADAPRMTGHFLQLRLQHEFGSR